MNAGRVLWGFIVLLLNIMTIFLMKNKLDSFAEHVFLLLLLLFTFIILKGWKRNAGWAWPAMIIFLSMALANNVYIFVVAKNIAVFILLIIINVWSIVLSMLWSLELPSKEIVGKKDYDILVPEQNVRRGKQQ